MDTSNFIHKFCLFILNENNLGGTAGFSSYDEEPFLCVSGMAHILSVKVRPRVFVAKCSKPQAEGREAGVKEAV